MASKPLRRGMLMFRFLDYIVRTWMLSLLLYFAFTNKFVIQYNRTKFEHIKHKSLLPSSIFIAQRGTQTLCMYVKSDGSLRTVANILRWRHRNSKKKTPTLYEYTEFLRKLYMLHWRKVDTISCAANTPTFSDAFWKRDGVTRRRNIFIPISFPITTDYCTQLAITMGAYPRLSVMKAWSLEGFSCIFCMHFPELPRERRNWESQRTSVFWSRIQLFWIY